LLELPLFTRDDAPALDHLAPSRCLLWCFSRHSLLCQDGQPAALAVEERHLRDGHTLVVGRWGDKVLLAREDDDAAAPGAQWLVIRDLLQQLSGPSSQAVLTARAGLHWLRGSAFCSYCGAAMRAPLTDWSRECEDSQCGRRHFPRLDPAMIVLVTHQDQALLGRAPSWPEGRFSTLAGFVEPGETLEQAVIREVREEAGVALAGVRYQYSQAWPFPSSLMLGFRAEAAAADIVRGEELAEVAWYSRKQLRQALAEGELSLPPGGAISRQLIDDWLQGSPAPA
jgi:NAD+ diphosphatase